MEKLLFAAVLSLLILTGCDSQKSAAEAAFAQIQASVAPVSADLEKYAPDEYGQINAMLEDMKRLLNSKDYAGVVALQPRAMQQLISASGAAARNRNAAGKQEAQEWRQLSASVPALVVQLSERLTELQEMAGSLPAGVTRARLQEVAAALPELNAEWSATVATARSNNLAAAAEKARAIQKRCAELSARLGVRAS